MSRGAGGLCAANDHCAIDAVNVFLRSGTQLHIDNLILYQIKNDSKFTCEPKPEYFAAMDPYEVDILKAWAAAAVPHQEVFRSRC